MNALVHIHISFLRGVYSQSLVIKTLSPTDGNMASIYLVFEQKYIYMLYFKCLKKVIYAYLELGFNANFQDLAFTVQILFLCKL